MPEQDAQARTYRHALETSLRVGFRLEDVLPEGARLDLEKPFLPEKLARTFELDCLPHEERLALNHVRGHSYLCLFGLVEEFILPFVADHARARLGACDYETRALLQFASEEAKHIQLFKRFKQRFTEDFGRACQVIGPAHELARAVLAHHPIGVALTVLHIEWMTQRHYVDAVKDDLGIDPLVSTLLEQHWREEAQHARLDTLIVENLARSASAEERARGVADYHAIVALLDAGLMQQVELDLGVLTELRGRPLNREQAEQVRAVQQASYRYTFLESGAGHPRFLETYRLLRAA